MSQLEMFADAPAPIRKAAPPPEFTLYPDALIRRLGATLRFVQSAVEMPWRAAAALDEEALFLGCIDRLPPDRRGTLAEDFKREMARLRGGAIDRPA